jgi:CheY-like chemotaxis protein
MPVALIVEDEPEANKLMAMLLRLRGYETHSALTGRDGLNQVENSPPDVILLDLMLPDINGYEICKSLKSSKGTSLIPLLIVTARIAAENRIESFCLGADDYIAKPYTPDQIFRALEQAERWRARCRDPSVRGEIAFDYQDDGEILRRLGQLRSLIFARSELSLEAVLHVSRAVKEMWCLADEAERGGGGDDRTAFLAWTLDPDRLVLTFHQAAAWQARLAGLADDAASSLRLAAFTHMNIDENDYSVTLIKDLDAC